MTVSDVETKVRKQHAGVLEMNAAEVFDGPSAEGTQGCCKASGTQLVGALEADLQHFRGCTQPHKDENELR